MDKQVILDSMNKVRQSRIYLDTPVSQEDLATLLEVAQWTGSARNTQPWHFIVITDKATLGKLAALRLALERHFSLSRRVSEFHKESRQDSR